MRQDQTVKCSTRRGHLPHLTSQELEVLNSRIGQTVEGDLMRTTRPVGFVILAIDPFVPHVAIAVQNPRAEAVDAYIVAAKDERGGLVLVSYTHRVRQPVVNVGRPLFQQNKD